MSNKNKLNVSKIFSDMKVYELSELVGRNLDIIESHSAYMALIVAVDTETMERFYLKDIKNSCNGNCNCKKKSAEGGKEML